MATDGSSPDASINDPWTPDQETALLKALVHYKPVGLHAHFRMLSIRNHLLNSGTTDAETLHTRIPGIWTKIKSLYDIEQLNEREDEVFTSLDDDDDDNDDGGNDASHDDGDRGNDDSSSRRGRKRAKKDAEVAAAAATTTTTTQTTKKPSYWRDFELPAGGEDDDGFETLMWERRLNPEGTPDGSDWETRSQSRTKNGGGGDAADEPHSSPLGRGTRSGRKGRLNRIKYEEMDVDSPSSTRSSRRASKAASENEVKEDEDHPMEDAGDEDDDEGEDEEEEEESEDVDDNNEEDRKSGGSKRGRGGSNRGRGKRGRKRK